jgi:allantoicase
MNLAYNEAFDANNEMDTDFCRAGGEAFASFTLPSSELTPAVSASPVKKNKETASNAFSSLKSMLSGSSGNIPCQPLTQDAFTELGHVVQGYDSAESAPSYARVATSEEFKNVKVMDLAPVAETHPAEAGAKTGLSVFRCTPKEEMEKGRPPTVRLMER